MSSQDDVNLLFAYFCQNNDSVLHGIFTLFESISKRRPTVAAQQQIQVDPGQATLLCKVSYCSNSILAVQSFVRYFRALEHLAGIMRVLHISVTKRTVKPKSFLSHSIGDSIGFDVSLLGSILRFNRYSFSRKLVPSRDSFSD